MRLKAAVDYGGRVHVNGHTARGRHRYQNANRGGTCVSLSIHDGNNSHKPQVLDHILAVFRIAIYRATQLGISFGYSIIHLESAKGEAPSL